MAVTYKHTADGGYEVSRVFRSLGAAARGASMLESVVEAAFGPPVPPPVEPPVVEFEADPVLQALIERADEDAPVEHLKAGEAYLSDLGANPPLNEPATETGD